MKNLCALFIGLGMLLLVQPAHANTFSTCTTVASGAISCTGTLDTPEDFFAEPFTLTAASTVTVQTYGFGGTATGFTNAAGNTISGGGFDSLVALFSGLGSSDVLSGITILTDGSGNPIASVPGSTQFFPGCGPAGTVSIGGSPVCGDNTLTASLLAGTYTLLLSDANYIPFAVSPGPPISTALSDGFADLSPIVPNTNPPVHFFQTCDTNLDCVTDAGSFAVDITGLPPVVTPEPGTMLLLGTGLLGIEGLRKRRSQIA
jgi:hypothetical protein